MCFSKRKAETFLVFPKSGKNTLFLQNPFLPQRLTIPMCTAVHTLRVLGESIYFLLFFFFPSHSTVLHDRWSQLLWVFHGLLSNHKSFEKCGGGASPFSEVMGNGDRLNHRLCPVSKNVKMSNMKKTYFHIG